MSLLAFLRRLLFGGSPSPGFDSENSIEARGAGSAHSPSLNREASEQYSPTAEGNAHHHRGRGRAANANRADRDPQRTLLSKVRLTPLRYQPSLVRTPVSQEVVDQKPYRFGMPAGYGGKFLDLSRDGDLRWLNFFGLPELNTPDDLADWLGVPVGLLRWLSFPPRDGGRPAPQKTSHYSYSFRRKRSGGLRLIEAPKPKLLQVQQTILREILDKVPAHAAAHGFVTGRSIVTNAQPHVGRRFLLKLDLEEFYPSVRYGRVVAIFRSLGFSREVSLWLGRLTTSSIPWSIDIPKTIDRIERSDFFTTYAARHLPQGAPTSPALANLSAYGLDVRLSGLAEAYRLTYTRYADDLTFSGAGRQVPALTQFIPLVKQVIREERFVVNRSKLKVIRSNQRQTVTGVVVNEKVNVARSEYDRLKAILTNCIRRGPSTQNRQNHQQFSSHLRGCVAHVLHLNRSKGEKLLALYHRIDWSK